MPKSSQRLEPGATAQLIAYMRPDRSQRRESQYRIVAIADPSQLEAALESALGIAAVVEKERHLYLWEGVRIHLDRVSGLGSFIEFEAAVDEASDLAKARGRVDSLRTAFAIADADLVAGSYGDLANP